MSNFEKYVCCVLVLMLAPKAAVGQFAAETDRAPFVVKFKVGSEGESRVIPNWGIDTTWVNYYNARGSKKNAGDQIDFIRMSFYLHEPTNEDGSLTKGQTDKLDAGIKFLDMVDTEVPVMMSPGNLGGGIHDWYKNADGSARVNRWMNVIIRSKEYIESKGHKVIAIEPFNEPDHKKWNMGKAPDLNEILRQCKKLDAFRAGPSTLSPTHVKRWYNAIYRNLDAGATHTLGGTMAQYVQLIRQCKRDGKLFINPEAHSMVEAIVGAEEGVDSICWWDQISPRRAAFQKANLGKRLVYLPVIDNWSAACVYRDPEGTMYGFASTNERTNGKPTTFAFVCEDDDVQCYPSGKQDKAILVKKGKPFTVHVEADKDNKKNMSHWFVIAPESPDKAPKPKQPRKQEEKN